MSGFYFLSRNRNLSFNSTAHLMTIRQFFQPNHRRSEPETWERGAIGKGANLLSDANNSTLKKKSVFRKKVRQLPFVFHTLF